jgi:hypothetical protein
MGSPDSGCRCVGRLESISASGALIKTELGICPSAAIAVQTLTADPDQRPWELPAGIVRQSPGEIAVEWDDVASPEVFDVLTEALVNSGENEREAPALGRVHFCALAPTTLASN